MRDVVIIDGLGYGPEGQFIELTDEERAELEKLRRSLTADSPIRYLSDDDVRDLEIAMRRSSEIIARARRHLDTRPDGLA